MAIVIIDYLTYRKVRVKNCMSIAASVSIPGLMLGTNNVSSLPLQSPAVAYIFRSPHFQEVLC